MKRKRISRELLTLFPDPLRQCSGCKRKLPRTAFNRAAHVRDGLASQCKDCNVARAKAFHLANRERQLRSFTDRSRRQKYGLSPEAYAALIAAQQNKCAICEKGLTDGRGPNVDHCHVTGRVRQLLCARCNLALGYADDDPDLLRAMAAYIERHAKDAAA